MSFSLLQLTPVGPVSPLLPSVRAWKVQVSKAYVNGPRSRVMSDLIRHQPRHLAAHSSGPVPARRDEEYIDIEERHTLDVRKYWRILLKHKWLILAFLVTGGLLAKLENSLTTPLYRSSATIQIDPHSNVPPYEEIQAITEGLQGGITQRKILESRLLARRVVDRLDLAHDPPFDASIRTGLVHKLPGAFEYVKRAVMVLLPIRDKPLPALALEEEDENRGAVSRFLESLSVQAAEESRIILVSYSSPDPEFAALVVNTLAEEYIELNFESKFEATTKATDFLEKQLRESKIQIEKAEENLLLYARKSEYIDFSNQNDITLQKLGTLTEELNRVETELISLRDSYESVKEAAPENFPYSLRNETTASLERIRFGLEQRLARVTAQFGPNWPEVVQVRQELKQVALQLDDGRRLAIQRSRTDYETAQKRYGLLKAALNQEQHLATNLHEASIQYNILKREVDSNKQLYEGLLQRLKEAGVPAGLKSSYIRVVDPGEVSRGAYYPRSQRNLALGLLLGLFCGVSLAYLLDQLDNTVKAPEDVERELGLPSLGIVPAFSGNGGNSKLALIRRSDEGDARHVLWEETDLRSRMWAAYRALSMSILFSHSDHGPQVVLVSSALPKEGKSTTAINTAVVLAQSGARTLLLDLDLRKPSLGRTFGVENGQGMSTFLSGHSDFMSELHETPTPNLVVAPSGPVPPSPAELLGSERMGEAMALMRDVFKYIVIDSPPILSVTDPLMLTRHADRNDKGKVTRRDHAILTHPGE